MKLLLINPRFQDSFWSFAWLFEKISRDKKAVNPPLGLATVAALTPKDWEVTIIDENVEPIDWNFEADIVGVCGMQVQFERQKEIIAHFRGRGLYVVVGGSYASLCPEEYTDPNDLADTVIAGEAEYTWPEFCRDYERGVPRKTYRETGEINLHDSPPPRYDLLKLPLYTDVAVQFSRGCPFRCEFCDIIVIFGRKPRTKSLEQIERELDLLRRLGIQRVFFVDDNLIGHLPECRKLLAFLAEYQKRHDYQFSFGTEASINMAGDRPLMELFREAHFEWVFIGIESPSEEALLETKKTQNVRQDLLESVRTIYSYGIHVLAGFIIGFDADDETIFERQYRFIMDSGIVVSMVGLLVAIPKTPLYERLQKTNRLNPVFAPTNTGSSTNVIPTRMSYQRLIEGYRELHGRLVEESAIFRRIRNKLRYLGDQDTVSRFSFGRSLAYGWRFLLHGVLLGGYRRWYYFLRTLLLVLRSPRHIPSVITDWSFGLSLQRFALSRVVPASQVRPEADPIFLKVVGE